MTAQVTVAAPAKINLCLAVGPRRDDGYHFLATVYQAVGLYDDVRVRSALESRVVVEGDGVDVSAVPTDPSNLALQAATLLARHHDLDESVELHIRKRIPVAGGLAGGSADAAAALLACDVLWDLRTPQPELLELAAQLGSDVPFCLIGGTATGRGRGEVVTPLPDAGTWWWLILPAEGGLSTPAVYAEFDRLAGPDPSAPEIPSPLMEALRAADLERLAATMINDLQPAAIALRPELGELLDRGLAASARAALVSGSGPSTLYLCDSEGHASTVAAAFETCGIVASARVAGARVVDR